MRLGIRPEMPSIHLFCQPKISGSHSWMATKCRVAVSMQTLWQFGGLAGVEKARPALPLWICSFASGRLVKTACRQQEDGAQAPALLQVSV